MRIILCPAHFHLTNRLGSEPSWAYNIFKYLLKRNTTVRGYFYYLVQNDDFVSEDIKFFKRTKHSNNYSVVSAFIFSLICPLFFLVDLLRSRKIDIVHHVLPFNIGITFNLVIILFKNIFKFKVVVGPIQNAQSYEEERFKKSESLYKYIALLFKRVLTFLSDKTLERADTIVVINQYTKELLLRRKISPLKIKMIPPGIETGRMKYISLSEKKSDAIELLSVSYLNKRKGVDLIIKAIKDVIGIHNNIRLRIVGDGPQMGYLKELVNELNLADYVIFEGFVANSEVHKYYQKAHIFVNMSRSEGFATNCLEAMASGLAVVSSKVGGFSDAIVDGLNGFLVEQEDYKMLAKKLIVLIENIHMIGEFGRINRKEVSEKYDWEKVIIPKYLDVYRALVK